MGDTIFEETIEGGKHWSFIARAGTQLDLVDVEGAANVGMLFYNPLNLLERYNAPDTLKCQHTFKLTAGNCLYSDMGRIFCSIIADTHGWHDSVCGTTTGEMTKQRWGGATYQDARNDWQLDGRTSFLVEGAKYGLGKRDLAANVNWFSTVKASDDGRLIFDASAACAGASVSLRFEMDTLVLFHTCPHPLNMSASYPRKPVRYRLSQAAAVGADDLCRLSRPENARGFENNRLFHAGCGGH